MSSPLRKLIGARIRAYRNRSGLTQAALAEVIGCEGTTLGRYERGEYAPDGEQLVKIADFFEISPMDLLPGKVEVSRQLLIDMRAELTGLVSTLDDPNLLEKLITLAKDASKGERKTR